MRICVKELEQVLREQRFNHPDVENENELRHYLPERIFGNFYKVKRIDYDANSFVIIENEEDLNRTDDMLYRVPLGFTWFLVKEAK